MKIRERLDGKYLKISGYIILTVVVIYILARITDNMPRIVGAIGRGINWSRIILKPLFWGIVIAYILYPVMKWFERQFAKLPFVKKDRSDDPQAVKKSQRRLRCAAVAVTFVLALILVVILFTALVSTVQHTVQVASVDDLGKVIGQLATTLNNFYTTVQERLSELNISSADVNAYLKQAEQSLGQVVSNMTGGLMDSISHIGSFLTNLMFSIIFGIYFLLDQEGLVRYWSRVLRAISSKKFDKKFRSFLKDADTVFSGYIRGQLIDAVFMATVVSIALYLIHVRFAVIIGILTGIGNLIPYVGPFVAYGSTIIVCLINGDFSRLILALVILFIIQTIDGNVINPKFLSSSIHIHPLLVIACLIIGSSIGGLVGMIFAVPVGALIKMQFDRLIVMLIQKRNLEDSKETIYDFTKEADEKEQNRR